MKNPDSRSPYFVGSEVSESIFGSRTIIIQLAVLCSLGLTLWLWVGIFTTQTTSTAYFLDVGQGDSQLLVLEGRAGNAIKILIDGGKGRSVLSELDEALGSLNNKYIDVVILTHTDLDHFGGLVEVAKRYDIGLFVSNGRAADSESYRALQTELTRKKVPTQTLLAGDVIRYGEHRFTILSPDTQLLRQSAVNEASIVGKLETPVATILFTGDAGFPAEEILLQKKYDLSADILKVGHHGSKYSSSEKFIASVRPSISVIGVGKNSYGHPTPRVLETLELAGSRLYRTDEDGTIKIPLTNDPLPIQKQSEGFIASIASLMTGSYEDGAMTIVSLQETKEEGREFALISHTTCTFSPEKTPSHSPVIFNEIAWMGSEDSATHEWIELRNTSGKTVHMAGWQVVNENDRIHTTFPQQTLFDDEFMILARAAANDTLSLGADILFTGSLRNSKEGLQLFDNTCNLIDEIPLSSTWPAGNNKTKQTMQRGNDLSWQTSPAVGGTPRR